jgi:ATP-dependent DNA helicase RecG
MQAEYERARGFEPLQMEQMVLNYVRKHRKITRSEVADLCRLNSEQAKRLLQKLARKYPQF